MNAARAHRGLTLVETLATCAIAALAMALGTSLLTGAGDPLPRAEEAYLEARSMARVIALSDGPAMLRLEDGQLVVRDGRGDPIAQRTWPTNIDSKELEAGLAFDRLGRTQQGSVVLRHGSRTRSVVP